MRISLALLFAFTLFGCSAFPAPETQSNIIASKEPGLVGTWQWVSVTEGSTGKLHQVKYKFYIRYYPDGTLATWPTPSGKISRGRYALIDGTMSLQDTSGNEDMRVPLRIVKDEYWMTNENRDVVYYRRVVPDLEPGAP